MSSFLAHSIEDLDTGLIAAALSSSTTLVHALAPRMLRATATSRNGTIRMCRFLDAVGKRPRCFDLLRIFSTVASSTLFLANECCFIQGTAREEWSHLSFDIKRTLPRFSNLTRLQLEANPELIDIIARSLPLLRSLWLLGREQKQIDLSPLHLHRASDSYLEELVLFDASSLTDAVFIETFSRLGMLSKLFLRGLRRRIDDDAKGGGVTPAAFVALAAGAPRLRSLFVEFTDQQLRNDPDEQRREIEINAALWRELVVNNNKLAELQIMDSPACFHQHGPTPALLRQVFINGSNTTSSSHLRFLDLRSWVLQDSDVDAKGDDDENQGFLCAKFMRSICTSIEDLTLSVCLTSPKPDASRAFATGLAQCARLKKLSLIFSGRCVDLIPSVSAALASLAGTLKQLDLSFPSALEDANDTFATKGLASLQTAGKLTHLRISTLNCRRPAALFEFAPSSIASLRLLGITKCASQNDEHRQQQPQHHEPGAFLHRFAKNLRHLSLNYVHGTNTDTFFQQVGAANLTVLSYFQLYLRRENYGLPGDDLTVKGSLEQLRNLPALTSAAFCLDRPKSATHWTTDVIAAALQRPGNSIRHVSLSVFM